MLLRLLIILTSSIFSFSYAQAEVGACNLSDSQRANAHNSAMRELNAGPNLSSPEAPRRAYAVLYNPQTDEEVVLSAHNELYQHEVASTQKLLTIYTAYEEMNRKGSLSVFMDKYFPYSSIMRRIDTTGGSRVVRAVNELVAAYPAGQLSGAELFKATLNESSNGAAQGLANLASDDVESFMAAFNRNAEELLGEENHSCFQNPHGLQPDSYGFRTAFSQGHCGHSRQYSTMKDMALLTAKLLSDRPFEDFLYSQRMMKASSAVNNSSLGLSDSEVAIRDHFIKGGIHSTAGKGGIAGAHILNGPCKGWVLGVAAFTEGKTNACKTCWGDTSPINYVRSIFSFMNFLR